jgi:predicted nucleic acid-binding protein
MKYVLDASVAIRWVTQGPTSARALKLRDDFENTIHELIAPSHFGAEVASALTKLERTKIIPVGRARFLLDDIMLTLPVIVPYGPLLNAATEISSQTRSSVMDCLYVRLAEREQCELITADDKLIRNIQAQYPFVRSIATY